MTIDRMGSVPLVENPPLLQGAVIGVAALNRLARDLLEHALPLTWVRGEISNFTCAPSGHCYFTLKEAGAQVRCAMFRNRARLLDWQPRNGMQVEVRALVTLFEPRGEFQLNVEAIRRSGTGALYEAFERLKSRLANEGLFDPERKRSLPPFPRVVGIVTSPKAAALRDVLSVLSRRMPWAPIVLYPTPVQGAGAGQCIAEAIGRASQRSECDVLIVCRGGGSIEDLWAFNEEVVARSIRACSIPVVTGVGHETDFTIADFVADLRAPTPSAAAEAASPDGPALLLRLLDIQSRLERALTRRIEQMAQTLDHFGRRLIDPREKLRIEARHLRHLALRLSACATQGMSKRGWLLNDFERRLAHARPNPQAHAALVEQMRLRLHAARMHESHARAAGIAALGARLEALNPHAVLERGYAIAVDCRGRIVRDVRGLAIGEALDVRLSHGTAHTEVKGLSPPSRDSD